MDFDISALSKNRFRLFALRTIKGIVYIELFPLFLVINRATEFDSFTQMFSKLAATFLIASTVSAQNCKPSVLVDDFANPKLDYLPGDPVPRFFNLMGGDYGAEGLEFEIQGAQKQVKITSN